MSMRWHNLICLSNEELEEIDLVERHLAVSVRRTPCRSGREAVMARTHTHPTKGTAGTSDSSLVGWDGATMEGASSGR